MPNYPLSSPLREPSTTPSILKEDFCNNHMKLRPTIIAASCLALLTQLFLFDLALAED
jgi:hypothetical protein